MAGVAAFGTLLKRGNGATAEVFTTIANITTITGPEATHDEIDVTSHDSPDSAEEFILSPIKRFGEISFTANWDPADTTHQQLQDDWDAADEHNYQLVFPTTPAYTATFAAYVKQYTPTAPHDDKLTFEATLRITGDVEWA